MPKPNAMQRAVNAIAVLEKAHYPFKNYRHARASSVLFVGCNVVSLFPKTVREAARVLKEQAGVGLAFDCCGAPLALDGAPGEMKRVVSGVTQRLSECGVKELVATCPTCASSLQGLADIRVVSVYAKLRELNIGRRLAPDGAVFPPCPDRRDGVWLSDVLSFFEDDPPVLSRAPCCGLGERSGWRPPEKVKAMACACISQAHDAAEGAPYVYCASCAGSFASHGEPQVRYVLSEILGVEESPALRSTFANRACAKFL